MLLWSLVLLIIGTFCQVYSLFDSATQPYMQQLAFMFVAMPSVLAIIHHYYYYVDDKPSTPILKKEDAPSIQE
jgi:hypothetical protein